METQTTLPRNNKNTTAKTNTKTKPIKRNRKHNNDYHHYNKKNLEPKTYPKRSKKTLQHNNSTLWIIHPFSPSPTRKKNTNHPSLPFAPRNPGGRLPPGPAAPEAPPRAARRSAAGRPPTRRSAAGWPPAGRRFLWEKPWTAKGKHNKKEFNGKLKTCEVVVFCIQIYEMM